jgi:hypothetical protein
MKCQHFERAHQRLSAGEVHGSLGMGDASKGEWKKNRKQLLQGMPD